MSTQDFVECQRLLARFSRALDEGNYHKLSEQMTEDGVWFRQGERLEGRTAVVEALSKRAPDLLTRHLVTNIEIDFDGSGGALCRSTVVVFRYEGPVAEAAPMSLPHAIIDYTDTLSKEGGCWLIAERKSQRLFVK